MARSRIKALVKQKLDTTVAGRLLKVPLKKTGVWAALRPRRFHIYAVGAPRTGTTSMAHLFEKNYRSQHEPGEEEMIVAIQAKESGSLGRPELLQFLRERDLEHRFELEASHPIAAFAGELVELFPEARFLVTVRDCYSWLESIINKSLHDRADPHYPRFWRALSDLYHLRPGDTFPAEEAALERHGLYTLDGYLSFWTAQYRHVLDMVPEERRLTVRTDRISKEIERIAEFAGVPADTLDRSRGHANAVARQFLVAEELDRDYLAAKVAQHCGDLMAEFFPEMS